MPSATVKLDDNEAELMPERALFLRGVRALVVADLHIGKSESYRRFGVPSADGIDEETLERLECGKLCIARPARPTPLGLPLVADRLGTTLSTEGVLARLEAIIGACPAQ